MKTLIYAPYLLVVNYLYLNVFMLIKAVHARTNYYKHTGYGKNAEESKEELLYLSGLSNVTQIQIH